MTEGPRPFGQLIFDLDDTLLDTNHQLVPRASQEAMTEMIRSGLDADLQSCSAAWEEHGRYHARRDVFNHLVSTFGVRTGSDAEAVARRGFHAFYNRKVEIDISLIPGVRELLLELSLGYRLFLVTSGAKATQAEKIRILNIRDFFVSIQIVDPSHGETKGEAFLQIMRATGDEPERYLSIGNRIDTDIAEARALGWRGCWVRYGEHACLVPKDDLETPDFIISSIAELKDRCRL